MVDEHVRSCAGRRTWHDDVVAFSRSLRVRAAVAQLALGQLFGVGEHLHGTPPVASHLFNEGTAWNLALGIGLFWPRSGLALRPG
ncbi:hypothetical protein CLV71_114166 [Actinophytocola oryzae]|uniref:Uncharacterized protein n=2 Tax=Actinophytocola oryzae TaxID=502181 RepID=A0A4R7V881_9PSEU|nr:hypothetical protein CLV71_114166 [Actinophytocola oryzae]